jgi:hypothetical protein
MDPAMMGGMPPPMPPDAGAPAGTPVTVNLEDLKQLLGDSGGKEDSGPSAGRVTTRELSDKIDQLSEVVFAMAASMNIMPPAGGMGIGAAPSPAGTIEPGPVPEDLAAAAAGPAMAGEGVPPMPGVAPVGGSPMEQSGLTGAPKMAEKKANHITNMLLKLKMNR